MTWLLAFSGVYGAAQCLRGIDAGYDRTLALADATFHLYPLFFFLGLDVGVRRPEFFRRLILLLAWVHGIYGVAYMAFLHQLNPAEEVFGEVGWFGDPGGSAVVLLGLLAFEPRLSRAWLPLLLNLGVLLALQVRAEMLGLMVGVLLWGCLTGRLLRLCVLGLCAVWLLLAAATVDISIPSPKMRGGEISAQTLLGKWIAPADPEMARHLKCDADTDSDTVTWRTTWWREICARYTRRRSRRSSARATAMPYGTFTRETCPTLSFALRITSSSMRSATRAGSG